MPTPLPVSVVIPLYNKGPFIARAVSSVIKQECAPSEIIVVDDGSTDDGAQSLEKFQAPVLRVVRQENQGVSAARNRGANEAKHGWLAFLDADDEWTPQFLRRAWQALEQNGNLAYVFSNYLQSTGHKRTLPGPDDADLVSDDYYSFAWRHHGFGITSSSLLVRVDLLAQSGGFPDGRQSGEDLDTWFRMAAGGELFAYLSDTLIRYHNDTAGLTKTEPREMEVWKSLRNLRQKGVLAHHLIEPAKNLAALYNLRTAADRFARGHLRQSLKAISGVPVPALFMAMIQTARILRARRDRPCHPHQD